MNTYLIYTDSDGALRTVKGLTVTQDKAGRYWVWSEQLKQNLAYKAKTMDDAALIAIDLLLFMLKLKQKKLDALYELQSKVSAFVESVTEKEEE